MLLIWYPSDDARKIVGISCDVERLRGIKVPKPRPEFAGRCAAAPYVTKATLSSNFLKSCFQINGLGLLAIEQTNRVGDYRSLCDLAGDMALLTPEAGFPASQ